MAHENPERLRQEVRQRYGDIVRRRACGCASSACCGDSAATEGDREYAARLGYLLEDIDAVPEGANLSLGCGNPLGIASLRSGETVLDLGSGAGLDCFLAARQVGANGHVIGVDMTPEMVQKARENARKGGYHNVEFRLGEIEHLPVADSSIDVILSNCVINLSPDKRAVFQEAYRVLKPGGRLAIADTVTTAPLPEEVRQDPGLWSACIAGAATLDELESLLREAGFEEIRIQPNDASRAILREWVPGTPIQDYILSAFIQAIKPAH